MTLTPKQEKALTEIIKKHYQSWEQDSNRPVIVALRKVATEAFEAALSPSPITEEERVVLAKIPFPLRVDRRMIQDNNGLSITVISGDRTNAGEDTVLADLFVRILNQIGE